VRKWIFGLGNPEKKYFFSRHNAGFLAIDELSRVWKVPIDKSGFMSLYGVKEGRTDIFLIKPLTYMNHSGECVLRFVREFRIKNEDILVVHDDMDLPLGVMRFKRKDGSGGHKGIDSIIQYLNSGEFNRLRIGIGRPPEGVDPVDYVLGNFGKDEKELLKKTFKLLPVAVEVWIKDGIEEAMNCFNNINLYKEIC
jgi:PTH1 family peptidyl-tRNA hydrolase